MKNKKRKEPFKLLSYFNKKLEAYKECFTLPSNEKPYFSLGNKIIYNGNSFVIDKFMSASESEGRLAIQSEEFIKIVTKAGVEIADINIKSDDDTCLKWYFGKLYIINNNTVHCYDCFNGTLSLFYHNYFSVALDLFVTEDQTVLLVDYHDTSDVMIIDDQHFAFRTIHCGGKDSCRITKYNNELYFFDPEDQNIICTIYRGEIFEYFTIDNKNITIADFAFIDQFIIIHAVDKFNTIIYIAELRNTNKCNRVYFNFPANDFEYGRNCDNIFIKYTSFEMKKEVVFKGEDIIVEEPFSKWQYEIIDNMCIIKRKDVESDKCLLDVYGGFNSHSRFSFDPSEIYLLDHGISLVFTILSGDGSAGIEKCKAGEHLKEPAINEALMIAAYLKTRFKEVIIRGASNGGLIALSSYLSNPELFDGVISNNGLLDVLNFTRYGKIDNFSWASHYEDAEKYAPFLNIKKRAYPKVLINVNTSDEIVAPINSIYASQKMLKSKLFEVDDAEGHSCTFCASTLAYLCEICGWKELL